MPAVWSRLMPISPRATRDRNRAEVTIREQAALLDLDPDAIIVRSIKDTITFWNKGAERLYGWTKSETIGKKFFDVIVTHPPEPLPQAQKMLLDHGEWRGEAVHVTKDGKRVSVQSHWTLVRNAKGKPTAVCIMTSDFTERKKLEEQLLRAQRMESIGTLAGGIAHDLNNILSPIMMGVHLLKRRHTGGDDLRLLETMERSVQRGVGLVRQVLTFARGTEGERVVLQVKQLVSETEKFIRETFAPNIRCRTSIAPNLWMISADPTQLHQILMNLCINARDAMPQGGLLQIEAENMMIDQHYSKMHPDAKPGPYVAISIVDNGTGIPTDVLDKIFEPFFTTKDTGKGTGLGLSTVQGIVKSHGGFVTVYSELGKGTKFTVHFLANLTSDMRSAEAPGRLPPRANGELILVVDDEIAISEITKTTLEMQGYKVLVANDGAEAVAMAANQASKIDLVLTDMVMPYLDGAATIHAIQKLSPTTKFIGMSGFADNFKSGQAHFKIPIRYLQKPFTAAALLDTLHEVLKGPTSGI